MWGSEFPKWVNLGVIALSYSCIAPLVLGFSTIGLALIYIAFRYNFLYTYEPNIDTRGAAYQKAVQQLMTGVYISELCLIGLFAIAIGESRAAIGPLVIEVILLAFSILFHVTLRRALVHHEARVAYQDHVPSPTGSGSLEKGNSPVDGAGMPVETVGNKPIANGGTAVAPPKPTRLPNFLLKFINPARHSIPNLAASLEPYYHKEQTPLPSDIAKRAFFHPAVTATPPVIWIVRDEMGISAREVEATRGAVPGLYITDEQATFNEKNKVHWDGVETGKAREAPVYEEDIVY